MLGRHELRVELVGGPPESHFLLTLEMGSRNVGEGLQIGDELETLNEEEEKQENPGIRRETTGVNKLMLFRPLFNSHS